MERKTFFLKNLYSEQKNRIQTRMQVPNLCAARVGLHQFCPKLTAFGHHGSSFPAIISETISANYIKKELSRILHKDEKLQRSPIHCL